MKKILLIIILLITCSCSIKDKYNGFEHYTLKDNPKYEYDYRYVANGETFKDTYAIADLTESEIALAETIGLFYKIKEDDYILLFKKDTRDVGNLSSHNAPANLGFYDDKLYLLTFDVDKDYVYLNTSASNHTDHSYLITKCSLKTYECEVITDNN